MLIAAPVATNFGRSGDQIASKVYGADELAVWKPADVIGPFLRHRDPHAELFVAGSDPQYYWRSGLRPANRWLFDYPADFAPERFLPDVAGLCVDGPRFVVLTAGGVPDYARRCTAANGYVEILRRGPVVVLDTGLVLGARRLRVVPRDEAAAALAPRAGHGARRAAEVRHDLAACRGRGGSGRRAACRLAAAGPWPPDGSRSRRGRAARRSATRGSCRRP